MKKLMKTKRRMMKRRMIPGIITQTKRRMWNVGHKRDTENYSQPK
jgi:hypothetical protein